MTLPQITVKAEVIGLDELERLLERLERLSTNVALKASLQEETIFLTANAFALAMAPPRIFTRRGLFHFLRYRHV